MSELTIAPRRAALITGEQQFGDEVDVLLVSTPGGHLAQLFSVRGAWYDLTTAWVTGDTTDARSLLARERVYHAHGPAERSLGNLVRNLRLAWTLIAELRPKIIVSTGAAICVPFVWVGRIRGAKIVFIESVTRIDSPSLTCRLVRPVAHRIYVQWPDLAQRMRGSCYVGSVFAIS